MQRGKSGSPEAVDPLSDAILQHRAELDVDEWRHAEHSQSLKHYGCRPRPSLQQLPQAEGGVFILSTPNHSICQSSLLTSQQIMLIETTKGLLKVMSALINTNNRKIRAALVF